jgi:hypothetical protein
LVTTNVATSKHTSAHKAHLNVKLEATFPFLDVIRWKPPKHEINKAAAAKPQLIPTTTAWLVLPSELIQGKSVAG